jgi:hypothetical protein
MDKGPKFLGKFARFATTVPHAPTSILDFVPLQTVNLTPKWG